MSRLILFLLLMLGLGVNIGLAVLMENWHAVIGFVIAAVAYLLDGARCLGPEG